jgi:hypothetical protein
MTAVIIDLAEWRAEHARFRRMKQQLPSAIEVAFDHIDWLRARDRELTPYRAGLLYGLRVFGWIELAHALADIWLRLPEEVRRAGNNN